MVDPGEIFIREFDYVLPPERIAFSPLSERDGSKLLCYKNRNIIVSTFRELGNELPSNSSLILNNTRVIEARILFQKNTGGTVEIFCLEPEKRYEITEALNATSNCNWLCYIGGASKWKHGEILKKVIDSNTDKLELTAQFMNKKEDAFIIQFSWTPPEISFAEVLHLAGCIPLPPYIKRKTDPTDADRYQTIFAQNQGSVAAPTAALHFTQSVFDELSHKNIKPSYVTLHVGAGTFKPVKSNTIAGHLMHAERFEVSMATLVELKNAKELIAAGTTSLRTMESLYWIGIKILKGMFTEEEDLTLAQWEPYELLDENISYAESIEAIIDFLNKKIAILFFAKQAC